MSILNPWLWVAIAAAVIGAFFAGDYHGAAAATSTCAKNDAAASVKAEQTVFKVDTSLAAADTTISQAAAKVDQNETAKTVVNTASLRSGAIKLRLPGPACQAGNPGTPAAGHDTAPTGGTDVLPETAGRIYDIARDADKVVRERDECIAKYNSARDTLLNLKATQ